MRALLGIAAGLLLCCVFAAVATAAPAVHLPDIPVAVEWLTGFTGHSDGAALAGAAVGLPFSSFFRRGVEEPAFDPDPATGGNDLATVFKEFLQKQGANPTVASDPGALKAVELLTGKLQAAETENAALKTQLAEAKTKVPADGEVVLKGDEAKAYTALKAREGAGETPLKKAADDLTAAATSAEELAKLRTSTTYAAAAAKLGLNATELEKYVPGLTLEDAEAEVPVAGGKKEKRQVPHVVTKGADGAVTKKPLLEVLQADHAALLPGLKLQPGAGTSTTSTATGQHGAGTGATRPGAFVGQTTTNTDGGASGSFDLDGWIAKRNAARAGQKPEAAAAPAQA